jgi:hypothetical protein
MLNIVSNQRTPQKTFTLHELVSLKEILERSLIQASAALSDFQTRNDHKSKAWHLDPEYINLADTELGLQQECSEVVEAIFGYEPQNGQEHGLKISTLLSDVSLELLKPTHVDAIKRDQLHFVE